MLPGLWLAAPGSGDWGTRDEEHRQLRNSALRVLEERESDRAPFSFI